MSPQRCLPARAIRQRLARRLAKAAALGTLLLAAAAQAQPVYRCGNSYGTAPCPGGQAVAVDDPRSDDQRRQALAVKRQEANLARALAAERREREQSAQARMGAAGIGPTAAQRQQREADAAQATKKQRMDKRRHLRRATHLPATTSPT